MGRKSRIKKDRRAEADFTAALTACEGTWLERPPTAEENARISAAQHELGKEFADALHTLNVRLQALRDRLEPAPPALPEEHLPAVVSPPYLGETQKLDPEVEAEHAAV